MFKAFLNLLREPKIMLGTITFNAFTGMLAAYNIFQAIGCIADNLSTDSSEDCKPYFFYAALSAAPLAGQASMLLSLMVLKEIND